MKKNFLKILSVLFVLCFINTNVYASNLQEKKEVIEVEILVNLNDEDFAENIVFEDGTRLSDFEYSVKYVPMTLETDSISNYFDFAAWITRDGVISLSIDPNDSVRTSRTEKDKAWKILSSTTEGFGGSPNWQNTKVMGWQYDCHFMFAKNKDYWNLEPHRTASSYIGVVAAACNP